MRLHYCEECERLASLAIVKGMCGSLKSAAGALERRSAHRAREHQHSGSGCLEGERLREICRGKLQESVFSVHRGANLRNLPRQLGEIEQQIGRHYEECGCPESRP
jgi:hypothetical protein